MASNELWLPPSAALKSEFKKAPPPKMGDQFGAWAGRDVSFLTLPGGGVLQFDLSRLTLQDFRSMRDHYQINSSLSILSFMMHQMEWHIECEDQKIADAVEGNLRQVWTRLMRGMSQAYWAGYSPLVIEWDNDIQNRQIVARKFKDLLPEECLVNWKKIEGYAPPDRPKPTFYEYDGIRQYGAFNPIPAENTLWYPLLMENGDYYGRKLLKPAFPSWFFSILIHLFANRYFERFGEPVPVGRAPFEDAVVMNGKEVTGRDAMLQMLESLRSRSVVVMPSERDTVGNQTDYLYDIEYLESQMRGADFERYLTRLDEEMSIGLFTPILLMRTADVGSYNLGVGHMQMYQWLLNALAGDLKDYIDRFYVNRFVDYNFGPNAKRAYWMPRPMGKSDAQTMREIVTSLIGANRVKPDLEELGAAVGLSLEEVKQLTTDEPDPLDPDAPPEPKAEPSVAGGATPKPKANASTRNRAAIEATVREIKARIEQQTSKAFTDATFGKTFKPSMGYRGRMKESLKTYGFTSAVAIDATDALYTLMDRWLEDVVALGTDEFSNAEEFHSLFGATLEAEVTRLAPG